MAGLKGQLRTPRAPVRERRNTAGLSAFAQWLDPGQPVLVNDAGILTVRVGDGIAISSGNLVVDLASTPGLQFISGELAALVQGVLAVDASGILLNYADGLENDGSGNLQAALGDGMSIVSGSIEPNVGDGLTLGTAIAVALAASGGLQFVSGELAVDPANVDHDALANFLANEHVNHSSVSISAGTGLSGGGDLTASRTLSLDVNGLTAESAVDAANDYFPMYDASAGAHRKVLGSNLPGGGSGASLARDGVLAPHAGLLIQNNASNPSTQVDIDADGLILTNSSGGQLAVSSVDLTADITSSGANGLDTGSEASSAWYHLWVIHDTSGPTTAALLSTSSTSPTMPSGYTYKGYVGAIRNESSGDLNQMVQRNTVVQINDFTDLSGGTASSYAAIAVTVPATATHWIGSLGGRSNGSGEVDVRFISKEQNGVRIGFNWVTMRGVAADTGVRFGHSTMVLAETQTLYYQIFLGNGASLFTTGWSYF